MNQQEFTDFTITELIKSFPQFTYCITHDNGGVAYIRYKSNAGKIVLWVDTTNKEITVGFGNSETYRWHTHMSLFGATTPAEELEEAIKLINDILSDVEPILYLDSEEGFYLISDIEAELKEYPNAEVYKWSQL